MSKVGVDVRCTGSHVLYTCVIVCLAYCVIVLVVGTDGKTLVWCQLTRIYIVLKKYVGAGIVNCLICFHELDFFLLGCLVALLFFLFQFFSLLLGIFIYCWWFEF